MNCSSFELLSSFASLSTFFRWWFPLVRVCYFIVNAHTQRIRPLFVITILSSVITRFVRPCNSWMAKWSRGLGGKCKRRRWKFVVHRRDGKRSMDPKPVSSWILINTSQKFVRMYTGLPCSIATLYAVKIIINVTCYARRLICKMNGWWYYFRHVYEPVPALLTINKDICG